MCPSSILSHRLHRFTNSSGISRAGVRMCSKRSSGVARQKLEMSVVQHRAFFVDTTLFHEILLVAASAVLVVTSPGKSMRFPPAVIPTQCGSFFCGRQSTTMHACASVWSFGMSMICLCVTKNRQSVPFVTPSIPCDSRSSSLLMASPHSFLVAGFLHEFLQFCGLPVIGPKTM